MSHVITAPDSIVIHDDHRFPRIFLAGGITDCADWQSKMIEALKDQDCVIVNPRRKVFEKNAETDAIQIKWEFDHLRECDIILFWFCKETLCPITLFELGNALGRNAFVFEPIDPHDEEYQQFLIVGCDPEYKRKSDVEFQLNLAMKNDEGLDSAYMTEANDELPVLNQAISFQELIDKTIETIRLIEFWEDEEDYE